jgi:hypothetical protein
MEKMSVYEGAFKKIVIGRKESCFADFCVMKAKLCEQFPNPEGRKPFL